MNVYELGATRTNNFAKDVGEKIGDLWKKSMEQATGEWPIYAIYHEYAGDFTADYTLSLAVENNREGKEIFLDEGNYQIFTVEPDPTDLSKGNVLQKWQEIWALEKEHQIKRRYQTDYEKYHQDGQITIHISVE